MRALIFGNFPCGGGYPRTRVLLRALELAGVECIWAHQPLFNHPTERKQMASSALWAARVLARAARGLPALARAYRSAVGAADLIFVGYGGILDQSLARRLDRHRRKPLLVDAFLSLRGAVLDRGVCAPGSWRARYLRRLDRKIAQRADLTLVDTPMTAAYLAAQTGLEANAWAPIPVGSDLARQPPRPRTGKLRLLFVGTGVALHGSGVLLAAMRILEERGLSFELVFVGGTAADRRLAAEMGLEAVRFIDRFVEKRELEELHAACDLVLGVFDGGAKAARVVPCKIYDALACGRMVISADTLAVRELLGPCAGIVRVPAGDPRALAAAVEAAAEADTVRAGVLAGELFDERFTTARIADRLSALLEALLARPR